MKSIQISHNQELKVIDCNNPGTPAEGEVLLKIEYVGFCGSDINTFMGRNTMALIYIVSWRHCAARQEFRCVGRHWLCRCGMKRSCRSWCKGCK